MNKDFEKIKKYLADEQALSQYKIDILSLGGKKTYKDRLLAIEADFLSFDFLSLNIENFQDFKDALSLFKLDRDAFDKKFSLKKDEKKNKKIDLKTLKAKIAFFEQKIKWIIEVKLATLNICDNKILRSLAASQDLNDINNFSISALKKAEGSLLAKKRARIQLILFCFSKYLYFKIKKIKEEIGNDEIKTNVKYFEVASSLDLIFKEYKSVIFSYWNESIAELNLVLSNTKAENDYIEKLNKLSNLIYKDSTYYFQTFNSDVKLDNKSNLTKKHMQRLSGISFDFKRLGNEAINILYKKIVYNDNDISNIFDISFFNYYDVTKKTYYKNLASIPLDKIYSMWYNNKELYSFFDNIFKDDNFLVKLDSDYKILQISNDSQVLIPETRSDAEYIAEALEIVDLLILSIEREYYKEFKMLKEEDFTEFSKRVDERKTKLKNIMEI